jgi:UDP-2,3-diacylglucosamine hydrolase
MADTGKYYFACDLHLGLPDPDRKRERLFVDFLNRLPADAKGLFLLGDIFDFWVDYKDVVPRGGVRALAAIAAVAERMPVWYFRGNHDWWVTDYFEKELGVKIVREPYVVMELQGQQVCIGHGDTLGCRDAKSWIVFHLFRNRALIALLRALHPRWVFRFAHAWSAHSRKQHPDRAIKVDRQSGIYRFANEFGKHQHIDRYIFGHWHSPAHLEVESGGILDVIGDWSEGENYLTL